MNTHLTQEFEKALASSEGLHVTNVRQDYLPVFVRVAKDDPEQIKPVVEMFVRKMKIRGNTTGSLYCLMKLADASDEARRLVKELFPDDLLAYYTGDSDEQVANNAKIFRRILDGEPLKNFERKEADKYPGAAIYMNHSNLAINSPSAQQSVEVRYDALDENTQRKLQELEQSLRTGDRSRVKAILGYLADKAFDVLVALIAGKILK